MGNARASPRELYRATVTKVVSEGPHGPFAWVSTQRVDGPVTLSLTQDVWQEDALPEGGSVILIGDLRAKRVGARGGEKRTGWRAHYGRFLRPEDERLI